MRYYLRLTDTTSDDSQRYTIYSPKFGTETLVGAMIGHLRMRRTATITVNFIKLSSALLGLVRYVLDRKNRTRYKRQQFDRLFRRLSLNQSDLLEECFETYWTGWVDLLLALDDQSALPPYQLGPRVRQRLRELATNDV